ncbi:hypothetical protein, partial [Brucella melitensis]|uniref:hypothetical protein n=1 Tax=Brucella melitensis TaxID=29459 RepID=UPI003B6851CD
MDSFQTAITDHQQRILSLESFANSADSCWQATEAKLTVMAAENAKLKAKLIDLEGRSRRNNIR